jgi:hypothetical protein
VAAPSFQDPLELIAGRHAAIARDGAYRIDGLPRGTYVDGLVGPAGHGTRHTRSTGRITWPSGIPIEVILRAPPKDGAQAWLFRGKVSPKTRRDAQMLAAKATDVITTAFHPIGSDATEAGRETYEPGDQHAIVVGFAPGDVTVCVIADDVPSDAPVFCLPVTVEDTGAEESARVLPVLFKT